MSYREGDRVVALETITESGRAEFAEEHQLFPHANYIHARPGEQGTVVYIEPDQNNIEVVTVRFDRTGTATLVRTTEYKHKKLPPEVKHLEDFHLTESSLEDPYPHRWNICAVVRECNAWKPVVNELSLRGVNFSMAVVFKDSMRTWSWLLPSIITHERPLDIRVIKGAKTIRFTDYRSILKHKNALNG